MTTNLSPIYVPPEGNENARILFIGEAPGEDERRAKRPFVGKSGQFLERYIGRAGSSREECFFANLCNYQPNWNKFTFCLDTDELRSGIKELTEIIEKIKPNVIVALGNWPMFFLTGKMSDAKNAKPGSGISTWRGSVLPCTLVQGYKVLVTYHPSYIIRPEGFHLHPVFQNDLKKAIAQSKFPELRYPTYEEIIDPPRDLLDQLLDEFSRAKWLALDIETFGDQLACLGICDGLRRGVTLTFKNKTRNWEATRAILAMNTPKIFQYDSFDINYLYHYYGWETVNLKWDTYVAMNNLFPGFDKTLAFMTSLYTDFPYYKEDRKTWKMTGDLDTLWRYNIKDCVATYMIAMQQMAECEAKWR